MNHRKYGCFDKDNGLGCLRCANNIQPMISGHDKKMLNGLTRREFIRVAGTSALGALAMTGLPLATFSCGGMQEQFEIKRKPLRVKPVLTYEVPVRREQTTWRNWGGVQTEADALEEIQRITSELKTLQSQADFPVDFMPVASVKSLADLSQNTDMKNVDLFLVYAAGGGPDIFDFLIGTGKDVIMFCRHKSGPVYLWYEIISPRYLRRHTDAHAISGIDFDDVVIDSQNELLWRLRALCGLKNTLNTGIVAVGGVNAWSQPADVIQKIVEQKYKFNIQTFSYDELGKLITAAMADRSVVSKAAKRADAYLNDSSLELETKHQFVKNCFVLEDVFKTVMGQHNYRAITINECMGTIMQMSKTAACLSLGLLNDAGYLAFCESDFVAVPAGVLMANITGKPVFFCNPTFPHDGMKTLSHCTAPRRMDGKNLEPVKILTHFESDYGAAPKVEMKVGQTVTNIISDFSFKKNVGLLGKIVDNPFMPVCRTQINISYDCDDLLLAENMPGFHWITVYGNYLRESGYALKKIGITLEKLGQRAA